MNTLEAIGIIAGLLTLIGYLPQTLKTIRTKRTEDLSLPTFMIIGISATLWTIYGFGSHKPAIWLTNAIVAICTAVIVVIDIRND